MKFFAVFSVVVSSVMGEAQLPIAHEQVANAGLYNGHQAIAADYAPAYGLDTRFAYGSPVTALTAGPLTPGPVTPDQGLSGTPPIVNAQYAASYAQYAQLPNPESSAPIAPVTSSQFQAQDEAGNIAYGYQNVNSAKQERGNIHGGVEGSYSYVDEAGVHTVNYVADDLGFRIVGDNLPVAPVGIVPSPVADTPEVIEARANFFAAFNAEASRAKRSAQVHPGTAYAAGAFYQPATFAAANYGASPLAYAAAPAREAILTRVQLNPGHALSYRVD